MKILHVTPDINFANNFVRPICLQQAKMGHYVKVISTSAYYIDNKKAKEFACKFSNGNPNLKLEVLNIRLRKFEWNLIKSYSAYNKLLKKENFDIIIFHTTLDSTLPLILAKINSRAKRIYFNHGVPALGYKGILKGILRLVEKVNIRLSNHVFTVGKGMSDELKNIDTKVNPILIKPGSACGVQLLTKDFSSLQPLRATARKRLGFSEDDKIVIYVGRPVKRKGLFDLIEAWKLVERSSKHHLLLIGPDNKEFDHSEFEKLNIKTVGYIKDIAQYYLCADVLCVPSYHEGLGYTYLEAASAGCVPVSSNIIGPTDFVIAGFTGLTVTPGDIGAIAQTLTNLIFDDKERERLSKNAFSSVINYDQEIIALQIAQKFLTLS